MNFFKKNLVYFSLLFLGGLNLLVFYYAFGFHINNDTESFIYTIDFFRGNESPFFFTNRYAVPFYGVVAAKLLFFLTPSGSLVVTNIFFYFGLLLLTFGLISRVFKNKWIGFATALFVATNYAMIRYGLTQVQDIGGYFWCVLTMYAIWRWREQKQYSWLILGGISTAFGVLTKETGGMGALFAGMIFLLEKDGLKKIIKYLAVFSFFPFITVAINFVRGRDVGFSSFAYFVDTWKIWGGNYTFLRFVGVNASTYNLAWFAVVAGLVLLYRNRKAIDRNIIIYFIAAVPTSISYLVWPVFISRTVFISGWIFLPLAAYALFRMYEKNIFGKYLSIFLVMVLLVAPYGLQNTLRYAHVFSIIDQCHNDPICSWNYFWQNRDSFSKIK